MSAEFDVWRALSSLTEEIRHQNCDPIRDIVDDAPPELISGFSSSNDKGTSTAHVSHIPLPSVEAFSTASPNSNGSFPLPIISGNISHQPFPLI
ncbi:hypothetical protein L1987_18284 [Smallanthus sonchifolius]|uniref:Uncharacterized protein n=1 Tax=Smallanthus sonchifolius TaxID=185202 RepID=A0ACB9J1G9_9ASTR|nr:hypothetical protein L1987_18284 [Smallanthus sonchifolius]